MRARDKRILTQRDAAAAVAAEIGHDAARVVAADIACGTAGTGCRAGGGGRDLVFFAGHVDGFCVVLAEEEELGVGKVGMIFFHTSR